MPLARANTSTRSKSRSPLPPSPRPPTFLPPSHYAEAGGLSPKPPARNDSLTSSSDYTQHRPQLESRRNSAFMPISSKDSDSSFEFGQNQKPKPVESKRFSISSGGSKAASRSKRESHMTNLPLVEAQLLPSLRDTIDRMTRPPSRAFPPPSPPEHDVNANESSPASPPRTQLPDDASFSFSPPALSTPKPLKSALRAPTPKLQLRSPRSPTPAAPPAPTSRLPSASKTSADASTPSPPIRSRPRSRTDPGAPQDPHASSVAPNPIRAKGSSGVSNIPRPRAVSGLRSASSTPRPRTHETAAEDSASDLELRYELEARNRRSLRVVNGFIPSESESDGEARTEVGLGLGLVSPDTPRSFASKLRARFTRSNSDTDYAVDEAAERRRKELLGLVKGLDKLGSQLRGQGQGQPEHTNNGGNDSDYGMVVSGSGRVDFGAAPPQTEPPRVMVSSSSGTYGEPERDLGNARREREQRDRPTSLWKRSRSLSPAPPPHPPPKDHCVQESRANKSPSRSPVIRQTPRPPSQADERADLMPDALRRHSVYHSIPTRPISPVSFPREPETSYAAEEYNLLSQSPESLYDEPDDDGEWPQEPHMPAQDPPSSYLHAQHRFQRHSDDLANSDTVILALHSRLAAAREREALGIPPSASDAGYADGDTERERMSYMDSGSSLARVGMSWEDGDGRGSGRGAGDLSFGAEKLFRTLSGRTVEGGGKHDSWSGDPEYAFVQDDILKGRTMDAARPTSVAFSQSSSASSMYEDNEDGSEHTGELREFVQEEEEGHDENEERSMNDEPAEHAWRATLPPITYAAIADRHGALEIQRQEAIHTLYVTEESFVVRLTTTINLFILPLRMQDSKRYISGVPAEIAKLFDWLEDILNLHSHLLSALRHVRETQHPVVERVAEAIRGSFVKQLEVYQPYLARLVNVAGTIARFVADTTSDFGEFVRIQQSVEECDGWSLESLLVDPVTRLGRYPAIFRKLHEYTPKSHADYVSTLALLHSTEMVIKVMTEVKVREDEYDLVKSMSRCIKGLPPSVSLAKRGRRLLFQGQLLRVRADRNATRAQLSVKESTLDARCNLPNASASKRSSNLVDALRDWDQRRERSGSNTSASTTASYSTQSSAASSESPVTPPHLPSRYSLPAPRSKLPRSSRPSLPQEGSRPSSGRSADPRFEETRLVQIFVFTDCVVVAAAVKSRHGESEEWSLLEDVGISRLLGVIELSNESNSIVFPVYSMVRAHVSDRSITSFGIGRRPRGYQESG
ncbi:hypothetical protein B0H19DRAFT_129835 [Mycena capillaripes]|nr:hypothetical protein B0H19DRAFT_129835 [Mycena capillaripes]